MQACCKLSCTKLFGGVEAEKVLVVFEILNNINVWLVPHYWVGYFFMVLGTPTRECDTYCIPKVISAGLWQVKLYQMISWSRG